MHENSKGNPQKAEVKKIGGGARAVLPLLFHKFYRFFLHLSLAIVVPLAKLEILPHIRLHKIHLRLFWFILAFLEKCWCCKSFLDLKYRKTFEIFLKFLLTIFSFSCDFSFFYLNPLPFRERAIFVCEWKVVSLQTPREIFDVENFLFA